MAMYGSDNLKEAGRYTRKANSKRLTVQAVNLVVVPSNDLQETATTGGATGTKAV